MKKTLLLLFALLLLSTTACNNDDDNGSNDPIDQLPAATQTGENTMGYLYNGVPISITNSNEIGAFYQQLQLQIGSSFENEDIEISLNILANGPLEEGINYDLVNNSTFISYKFLPHCFYDIEDTYEGSMIITNFDETNYIISGTFEFSTVTENCETVMITDGRFDVHYAP